MSHNVDHDETKKMLININQYSQNGHNQDLAYELDKNSENKQTVEEEYKETVRVMKKKDNDLKMKNHYENKICNKQAPLKKTMDNRVVVDINKKQIFKKMVELIYMNASQHINTATANNPQVLNANRNHWFQMMLTNPKLQKFYNHFNEQLSVIIKEEID